MSYQAYTGFWINWDHGRVQGATVTLDARNSQILSSFLASFLTVVGVQLWRIVAYTIHQLRERDAFVDGLHRQQQLVWKNYSGPASSAWIFLKQMWAWRKHARHSFLRTAPFAVLCAVYAVVFALLALFASSEITKSAGPYRLVQPGQCGYINFNGVLNSTQQSIKSQTDIKSANNYANSCYNISGTSSPAVRCSLYRKPKITWQSSHELASPWPGYYASDGHGHYYPTFIMDTGPTDSHKDWGINAPPEDRIQFRKMTTCAPTDLNANETVTNSPSGVQSADLYQINIGPTSGSNYTLEYDTIQRDVVTNSYSLDYAIYQQGLDVKDGWQPISPFNRSDADTIVMLFESNGVQSANEIDDPVFRSDVPQGPPVDMGGTNITFYASRDPYYSLSCIEQFMYCNPNNGNCQQLGSFQGSQSIEELGLNPVQSETHQRLVVATSTASMAMFLAGGGAGLLQASSTITQTKQLKPLPDYQWELEVSAMFDTSLARLQQAVLDFATGPANFGTEVPTFQTGQISRAMCGQQIVSLDDSTVSYSVVGLALTIALGVIIIVLSAVVEEAVGWIQRTLGIGENRRRAWILDSGFQLYRQLCQSKGLDGQWYKLEDGVPVCDRDAKYSSGCTVPDDFRSLLGESAPTSTEASPFITQDGVFPSNASMNRESTEYAGKTEPSVTL